MSHKKTNHFFFLNIQAVEYYAEWSLCPSNVVFLRVQTAVYDPSLIGDKPKWYAHQLQPVEFKVYDNNSSLGAALTSALETHSDENPTGKNLSIFATVIDALTLSICNYISWSFL